MSDVVTRKLPPELSQGLHAIVGDKGLVTDSEALKFHNTDWFGVINGRTGYNLDRIYHRWIHDYRYGRNW